MNHTSFSPDYFKRAKGLICVRIFNHFTYADD